MACPPLGALSLIRSTTSSSVSLLRAASTTLAPFLAAVSAVHRPMPLDAPVMTITCSLIGLREMDMVTPDGGEKHISDASLTHETAILNWRWLWSGGGNR